MEFLKQVYYFAKFKGYFKFGTVEGNIGQRRKRVWNWALD